MSKEILYALLAALSFGIAPLFEKLGLARTDPTIALFIRAFVTIGVYPWAFCWPPETSPTLRRPTSDP